MNDKAREEKVLAASGGLSLLFPPLPGHSFAKQERT